MKKYDLIWDYCTNCLLIYVRRIKEAKTLVVEVIDATSNKSGIYLDEHFTKTYIPTTDRYWIIDDKRWRTKSLEPLNINVKGKTKEEKFQIVKEQFKLRGYDFDETKI
ncbi:hypothetical protein DSECCO2_120610 [anaerobic digester metagenome]